MPAGASPEMQEEIRRQWLAQQQAILNAQANGQGLRANPGLGRGLVIPGAPNARQMPIRPNTGTNPIASGVQARLPPEQVQKILQARQIMAAGQAGQNATTAHIQRLAQARALQQAAQQAQQQAQLNAAQGNNTSNTGEYIPFTTPANGVAAQRKVSCLTKLMV